MKSIVYMFVFALCACRGIVPAVNELELEQKFGSDSISTANEMRTTLQKIVNGHNNTDRQNAIENVLTNMGIEYETEYVDWWMPAQVNIIMEFKGKTDRIIYIVAHTDKIDGAPHGTLAGQLSSGLTDMIFSNLFMSDGALDNGVGSTIVIQFAKYLNSLHGNHEHTYKLALFGGEEVGLKGSRSHVARISSDVWDRIDLAINLDMLGASREHVMGTNDFLFKKIQDKIKNNHESRLGPIINIHRGSAIPIITSSDHASFNGTSMPQDIFYGCFVHAYGGVLPSRSWFTWFKGSRPTMYLFSSMPNDNIWFAVLMNFILLPVSELHGPRDSASKVDPTALMEGYTLLHNLFILLDEETVFDD